MSPQQITPDRAGFVALLGLRVAAHELLMRLSQNVPDSHPWVAATMTCERLLREAERAWETAECHETGYQKAKPHLARFSEMVSFPSDQTQTGGAEQTRNADG